MAANRKTNPGTEPIVIDPKVFKDERGFFFEAFNQREFDELVGYHVDFVQDNHSRSSRWVLRGLHYQLDPAAQGKLVRVIQGAIFDVAVDIRRSSDTFGTWVGYELTASNFRQLWVPPGFAHGFLVLTETAEVLYKATSYYAPEHDRSIRWDDPDIAIEWPLDENTPVLSTKDTEAPSLSEAETFD
jgi:dTDP-4-dehydrorhamnose 3,5-epimerase